MRLRILSAIASLLPLHCLAQPAPVVDPSLNAVVWMQTSAEYAGLTRQTYRSATRAMEAALSTPYWTAALEQTNDFRALPPAVVLDLDETVLDNSAFQASIALSGQPFQEEKFTKWVAEARATAVPGAAEFLEAAVVRGVAPVYVTNRSCTPHIPDDPTVAVLRKLGLPYAPDRIYCRTTTSDKSDRRLAVAQRFRILLLIGDDFGDFVPASAPVAERARLEQAHAALWGDRWFLLPNPMYGSWERSVGTSVAQKRAALKP